MSQRSIKWMRLAVLTFAGGTAFQLGGCGNMHFLGQFNPCGTILNCDPVTYRFITSGYQGPGVNPSIDPACTYPPYCAGDPFVATGGNSAVSTGTGTQNFTNTGTTGTTGGSLLSGLGGGGSSSLLGGFGG